MATPKTHEKPYFPALGHVSVLGNSLTCTLVGGSHHATDHTTNRHGFKVFFWTAQAAPTFANTAGYSDSLFPAKIAASALQEAASAHQAPGVAQFFGLKVDRPICYDTCQPRDRKRVRQKQKQNYS